MRAFGVLLWVVAVLCFMGAFGMDTSVPTETGRRVHNIGLMRAQENAVLLGIGLLIAGAVFIALGGKKAAPSVTSESDAQDTKKCPFCAEAIKKEAILCRFCGKELPPVIGMAATEDPATAVDAGPLGRCPNCEKTIPLAAEICTNCKASFGPTSAWKIQSL